MTDTVAYPSAFPAFLVRWRHWLISGGATAFALLLYVLTAAPGLTWAHYGADGGELLAAAVTNGVPHPPGYPLYMVLLQAWLGLGQLFWPTAEIAWLGNLFSVFCAALSVGVTVRVAAGLTADLPHSWLWAGLTGLAWSVSPLPWSQALISEVYALHMLLIAFLGWAIFIKPRQSYWLGLAVALGAAHHLTFVLLLPAVLYYGWFVIATTPRARWRLMGWLILGGVLGLLIHIRTPLAAAAGSVPAPINWGYPDNWAGFWWLISGSAYRGYLFNAPSSTLLTRVAAWASTLTSQLTPVGLAMMLVGLSRWDRQEAHMRNFSLLWLTPISIYAINYYTRDSEIYLLPVIWVAMLWFAVGLATLSQWLTVEWPRWREHRQSTTNGRQQPNKSPTAGATAAVANPGEARYIARGLAAVVLVGLIVLTGWRWSTISARTDTRAQDFLTATMAVLEPHSIVISSADAETFALWYGAWGSGELLARHPDTVLINYALYQFPWYRRLVAELYPTVVGDSSSVEEILARNADRPIFFSERFSFWPAEQMEAVGPIWRYVAP
jgi:hypothetical protein